jgi:hypothetical protein
MGLSSTSGDFQGYVSAYVMQAYVTFSDKAKKNVSRGRIV